MDTSVVEQRQAKTMSTKVVKAAAVQLSPVLYNREGTVDKVVRKIHELGQQGVQFATFPEIVIPYYPYFFFVQPPSRTSPDPSSASCSTIGRPDMNAFHEAVAAATTVADLEEVVRGAIGWSDLTEFVRFDVGDVLRKGRGGHGAKILRLVVGNPLIMKDLAHTAPDAAAYAPITILVDERVDGVHLSYDSMVSLLAPYGSEPALAVAGDLDAKIESLLETAAR